MCHGQAVSVFPDPRPGDVVRNEVSGFAYGPEKAPRRIAILPDIYGCNPFYQGLALRYAEKGARVFLIDPFDGLGDLSENTREAAFARRGKVRDKTFLDAFEAFAAKNDLTGVVGFCLGGLYIFELARRGVDADLVGLYGFPQGLPNADPLPAPFDYLEGVEKPFSMLMGREDQSVGEENIERLERMATRVPPMDLHIYQDVGHGFLPLLVSEQNNEREVAEDALRRMDKAIL